MNLILLVFLVSVSVSVSVVSGRDQDDDYIDLVNQHLFDKGGWKAKRTEQSGKSFEEKKMLIGAIMPSVDVLKAQPRLSFGRANQRLTIAATFDARLNWPSCQSMKQIRNQGQCGSCWAHAGASVISDRICIVSGNTTNTYYQASVQEIMACSTSAASTRTIGSMQCNGGYIMDSFINFAERGVVTGGGYNSASGCLPYTQSDSASCPTACSNAAYPKMYAADNSKGSSYYALGNQFATSGGGAAASVSNETVIRQIQYELSVNGPLSVQFNVYEDFYSYSSGVYQHLTGNLVGGHAGKLLGWGTENGVDYWLLANSWGTGWGAAGFYKWLRGVNHLNIEDYLTGGIPVSPAATTTTAPVTTPPATTTRTSTLAPVTTPLATSIKSSTLVPVTLPLATTTKATTVAPVTTSLAPTSTTAGRATTPPVSGRPTGYDRCDALFCNPTYRANGTYQVYPCSRNLCSCSAGVATSYGCSVNGTMFDSTTMSCKMGNSTWCPTSTMTPPPNPAAWPTCPSNLATMCNRANCDGRDVYNTWYPLASCSPYWCYCWQGASPRTQAVQTCPAGQYFDFRSEVAACKPKGTLQWCP